MSRKAKQITITELAGKTDFDQLFPLISQLNPGLRKSRFTAILKDMLAAKYRCFGAWQGGVLVGACGLWTGTRFWCGKYMEVDNLVVDQGQRNSGVGGLLLSAVEKEARRLGCTLVMADSYTHNHASHRFYFRERYIIKGYCFVKDIAPPDGGVR